MLSHKVQDTLKLILRSPDRGDGWRTVSLACWKAFIVGFENPELIEIDDELHRVRLSKEGYTVTQYLI